MKKFINEFKEFISKGDVMSMAIGIIIGGAFTAIVSSLVNDVIGPVIGMIAGGHDFSGLVIKYGEANIMIGNFIQAIITFLLTALVLFSLLKAFNKLSGAIKKPEEEAPAAEEPAPVPEDIQLLTEIRDLLKK